MFNRKRTPDVKIHIEGFNDGSGIRCSQEIHGNGENISHAFAAGIGDWCEKMKECFPKDLVIFDAAVIMTDLIKVLGEDADEAWSKAHELLEGKDEAEENPKEKLLKALDDLIALFED